jgi:hypothetical protein
VIFDFHSSFGSSFAVALNRNLGHALSFALTLIIVVSHGFYIAIGLLDILGSA